MILPDDIEDNEAWEKLTDWKTIGDDGRILATMKDYTDHVKELKLKSPQIENRLIFLLNNIAMRQRSINIPNDLREFAERHL